MVYASINVQTAPNRYQNRPPRRRKGQTNLRALSTLSIHPSVHLSTHPSIYPTSSLCRRSRSRAAHLVLSSPMRFAVAARHSRACALSRAKRPRDLLFLPFSLSLLSCILLFFSLIPLFRRSEHSRSDSSSSRPTIFPHFNPLFHPRGRTLTRARARERTMAEKEHE